ncbi:MAG: hypothetical protein JWM14_2655 [Chitinophagaceae bacterium]|nr:hypothetical protein [Chitinophagaceae bacterium]
MVLHYKVIGLLLIVLSLIHVIFPKYFNWEKELSTLSLVNRQMIYVHTLFIALVLLLMGMLCFTSGEELVETTLGRKIALGFGIFWFVRLIVQFLGYSSKLWKGKTFETSVHIVFSLFWAYLSVIFLLTYFN